MPAFRARRGLSAGWLRVEVVAADAVERDLASAGVVERTVATLGIEPQRGEDAEHEKAVEQHGEREIGSGDGVHARRFAQGRGDAKGKEKRAGSEERGA